MEIIRYSIIVKIVLISNFIFCQNNTTKNNDTITFNFDRNKYNSIATDSIRKLYDKQRDYFFKDRKNILINKDTKNLISYNYNFNDLYYFSIPRFRLYRDGFKLYNCDENIEKYIVFEESNKYQFVFIRKGEYVLDQEEIPNYIFEYDRIHTPNVFTHNLRSKESYEDYLKSFNAFPELVVSSRFYSKLLNTKNFIFYIYGLNEILFEIDNNTGLLYANFIEDEWHNFTNNKMLANDFLKKFIGENIIKQICLGNYIEVGAIKDNIGFQPCDNVTKNTSHIFLKVNKK